MIKKTLGEEALERLNQAELTPIEMGEQLKKLTGEKLEAIIADHLNYADEYYIQILFQQENLHAKHLPNIHHLVGITTRTNPGMRPDRSCFKYNNKTQTLTYLWSLPDVMSCTWIMENQSALSPDEQQLLGFVSTFFNQCLDKYQRRKYSNKNLKNRQHLVN